MAALTRPALLLVLSCLACGRRERARECREVTLRANAFIAESARLAPAQGASREQTEEQARATAARYERLAADLGALKVESAELAPEVERYRRLASRSAAALRAVAKALSARDFESARQRRVELDREAHGEGPLVARINAICGH